MENLNDVLERQLGRKLKRKEVEIANLAFELGKQTTSSVEVTVLEKLTTVNGSLGMKALWKKFAENFGVDVEIVYQNQVNAQDRVLHRYKLVVSGGKRQIELYTKAVS